MNGIRTIREDLESSVSRRRFLIDLAAAVGILCWSMSAGALPALAQQTQRSSDRNGRAIKLRGFQELVRASLRSGTKLDRSALTMFGLTRIDAFIVDEKNQDCLLVGQADKRFPELYLGDFVTALRNVWFSPEDPACSIDPRQEDLAALMGIMEESRRVTSPEQMQRIVNRMVEVGRQPHRVSVFGVPFKSSFAQGLVEADYHMKKVAAGTVPHPAGLKSFRDLGFDWMVAQAKQSCGMAVSQPSVMARFWFHPSPPAYEEAKDIFSFKKVGIKLLTEEEHLMATGQRVQTGRAHPSAEAFREAFTIHYREAARRERTYARLRSLYRYIALSLFLKRRQVFERASLDLDLWLHAYPQDCTDVSETLLGISDVKQEEITCFSPLGLMQGPVWMPICGGNWVARAVLGDPSRVTTDTTGALGRFAQVVLDAEPTRERTLFWDFPLRGIKLEEF